MAAFRRYYNLVIPPVLLVEILADLTKEYHNNTPRNYVIGLASRIVPLGSAVNVNFRDLIDMELLGELPDLRSVPIIAEGEKVVSADGKKGVKAEQCPEMEALLRWQTGDFTTADNMTAVIWRSYAKGIDLAAAQEFLCTRYPGLPRLRKMEDARKTADEIIALGKREDLLAFFMEDAGAPPGARTRFLANLAKLSPGNLASVAPYTHHCVRATLIFLLATANELVSSRPTNRIDLEYLFYAPFANGFSSSDKFLVRMCEVALPDDQMFIHGEALRKDLLVLSEMWERFTPGEKEAEEQIYGPPENPDSVTHQVWQRYMKPGYRQRRRPKLTRELSDRLMELVTPIMAASPTGEHLQKDDAQNSDFLFRNIEVRLDGPCPCGERKTFKECCWAKAQSR